MNQTENPWDRLPGEPSHWYDRFSRYRLAGPSRSLLATYQAEREKARKGATKKAASVPSSWNRAAAAWRWAERAAAWDAYEAELRRRAAAEGLRAEIERHRSNGAKLDQAGFAIAVRMLDLARKRLDKLTDPEIECLPIELLPRLIRAAAAVAVAHLNGEAVALGTAEILRALEP
jgi:hypothetical protein